MTARGSGGPRQPANPAPVSNPGSGRRTDGGAGSATQPLRLASGGAYGQRKAATEQQQGAPLPAPTAPGAGGGAPPGGGPGMDPSMAGGVFGPGAPGGSIPQAPMAGTNELIAQDPQLFLRVLADKFPHPAIRRLVDWSAAANRPPQGSESGNPPPTGMTGRA